MSEDKGNRTKRGQPPAPYGTEDTVAAPSTPAPPDPADDDYKPSLPVIVRERYRIVAEVGRGGLGRVSSARDVFLDREVAVKELIERDVPATRRFVREALITARLQHPAIVPIYDAGQNEELGPFYAMKLVAGTSLADKLAEARTLDQRLALLPSVIAVVDAMAYAHRERIIHRDLKPQNVLVGDFGETVLIDWGLAKDLNANEAESTGPYREASESTQTMDGAVMGTPAFMAPEQAAVGESVDERADVYALGSMLYYLGAGVPPHVGKSVDEMLVKVVSGDVMPLPEREPRIPTDLAAIVAKAMMHDPAKRYPSARELSEDLHKFQTGKLVGAKTYTRAERLKRWVAKNRRIVAVTGVALAVLAGYGGWSLSRIYAERARAEDQAARALAAANDAAMQRDNAIAQAMLVRARQYAATGHAGEELAVLRALATSSDTARKLAIDEGGLVWKAHQRLAMAVGRDVGLAVRSADATRFIATEPGGIAVWDVASGREVSRFAIDSPAAARFGKVVAISPTGRHALLADCTKPSGDTCGIVILGDFAVQLRADARLDLRELSTGNTLATWKGGESVRRTQLAFAIDDTAIAIRRGDRVQVLGATAREIDVAGCEGALAISPAGAHIAVACKDHVRLVGADGTAKKILAHKSAGTWQLHFVAADRLLVTGTDTVKLWDLTRSELRGEGELPEAPDSGSVRDDGDDIDWSYLRPRPPDYKDGTKRVTAVPQIRIGSATSIVPRTSLLAPPPRLVANGAFVTLEGADWQALALDRDQLRYAMIDHLIPSEPPERCLPRMGGERHAAVALDGGARMLVDEQELAAGLALAPPEGYRHTTTAELPVRQLRPLVSAEKDACLLWGSAVGARTHDGGEVTPDARAIAVGGDLLVLDHRALLIARTGARTVVPVPGATVTEPPVASPTGSHLAALDLDRGEVAIVDVAANKVIRTFTFPERDVAVRVTWQAPDVAEVDIGTTQHLVSIYPAIAPRKREPDLVTDPGSRFGVKYDNREVTVISVADGVEVARYSEPGDRARPLPNTSRGVIVEKAGTRTVLVATSRVTLAENRHASLGRLEVVDGHLISRNYDSVAVWKLVTGRAFAIPLGARDVAIRGGELWAVTGGRKPKLLRIQLDGRGTRETRLSTPGLPLHHIRDQLHISPDGKRLTATYAVTEELRAVGTWDAEHGTLLWVGPPSARVAGDWVIAGGRAYIPSFDLDALLRDSGTRTNLRVCQDDFRAVPVTPPPSPDTYWAPKSACTGSR